MTQNLSGIQISPNVALGAGYFVITETQNCIQHNLLIALIRFQCLRCEKSIDLYKYGFEWEKKINSKRNFLFEKPSFS